MSDPRFRQEATIHQMVAEQVLRTPQAVALITDREQLTYTELFSRARRLAQFLIEKGVGIEEPVGVCLERSADLPVALLAVLLSGGTYLPLDPNYPRERIGFMLDDARSRFVITRRAFDSLFAGRADADRLERLDLDELSGRLGAEAPEQERTFPEALAYLIYTSGSTGRPKGVAIRHRNATAFFGWCRGFFSADEMRAVFAGTSICFDMSVFEIFYTLTCGGTMILGRDALHLATHPARDQVSLINTVPSAINELARLKAIPPRVLTINLGGEPLKRALTDEVYAAAPWVQRIYNFYGPSEDTTFSTWALVTRESREEPTIGQVLDGSEGYILDPLGQLLPTGELGELFLGGLGVSRCYLGRARQTAERYLPDPFSGRPGEVIYQTGDRVRLRPDGLYECLGRFDHQVKIRGFRVELGEIEAALARHPAVDMPLALVREDVPGDKRVVAYYQQKGETAPSVADLRAHLTDFLPHYMMPAAFVALPKMPLNPNGKIDRAALHALPPPGQGGGQKKAGPRTPLEEDLLALFAELLGDKALGIYDSFFEHGMSSLLATRAVARIEQMGLPCTQSQLFATPTVAALTEALENQELASLAPIPHLERGKEPLPVASGPTGLFYLWMLDKTKPSYNVVVAAMLRGRLEVTAFARALYQLAVRHPVLRTRFVLEGGLPKARVEPASALLTAVTDLRQGQNPHAAALERAQEEAARPFDLLGERLVRTSLLRLAQDEHLFVLTQHHVITDGISLEIFFRELAELYKADLEDREALLPALPIDVFDFAAWEEGRLAQDGQKRLDRWIKRLADLQPLELETDHPRPERSARRGQRLDLPMPPATVAAVTSLATQQGLTFFLVTSAAFYAYLAAKTGQRDLTLGTVRAGRNHPDLENLLGDFVRPLPVRVQLPPGATFLEALTAVRDRQLEAWDDDEIPFQQLAAALAPERSLGRNPLFDVTFQVREVYFEADFLPGLRAEMQPIHNGTSKFDLEISVVRGRAGTETQVELDHELFEAETIEAFFRGWHRFLDVAVAAPEEKLETLFQRAHERGSSAGSGPSAVRTQLHQLWCELLVLTEIDPDAHFFSLGGHSLLAARMIFRIGERFGVELPLDTIYSASTLNLLAARIEAALAAPAVAVAPAFTGEAEAEPLPTFGEERIFFAQLLDPKSPTYNIPLAVLLEGELDQRALARSLAEIELRHEVLRTLFVPTQSGLMTLLQPADFHLETFALPPAASEQELLAIAEEEARRPFNLRRGPVWRARLGQEEGQEKGLGGGRYLLLITLHHVVADGGSVEVFWRELSALYSAFRRGQPSPLPPLPLQIRDLASHQRANTAAFAARQLRRQAVLAGCPALSLPADFPRPEIFDSRGHRVTGELSPELVAALRHLAATHEASLFQVLLAIFFVWLGRRTQTNDLVVGIAASGRDRPQNENLIGFLVETLVLRIRLDDQLDFAEVLRRTQQVVIEAQADACPFEQLAQAIKPERDLSRPLLFGNFFQVYDGDFDLELEGLVSRSFSPSTGTAKYETDWSVIRRGNTYHIEVEGSAGLFKPATLASFLEEFLALVTQVATSQEQPISALEMQPAAALSNPAKGIPPALAAATVAGQKVPRPSDHSDHRGLERRLSSLWSELLQVEHVGLDDHFFELGGHSLIVPRLLVELEADFPELAAIDFFRYPTLRALAARLRELAGAVQPAIAPPSAAPAATPAEPPGATTAGKGNATAPGIAIVGMAGRFPGAADVDAFWQLITEGREALRAFSDEELLAAGTLASALENPDFVKAGGPLGVDISLFDPGFFGFSQLEAEMMDPQQRLFLECCWEALERAGQKPGGRIGVFAGQAQSGYLLRNLASRPDRVPDLSAMATTLATDKDYIATRVAYKLDLRGPALTVQVACATSLAAVHLACRSLLDGECDAALAGGVTLQIPQAAGYEFLQGGILSPDGHCRPFDQDAAGMVGTSGVGVVLLRRLEDAVHNGDTILAVIRASAMNNDGANKAGFTAPAVDGQREVLARALLRSGFAAESVGYIECHGTATALGDAIEVAALREVYGHLPAGSVAIGSLKSQVGHMDVAAGVGGLMRAALSVFHGQLPPTLHFRAGHPGLHLDAGPFFVSPGGGPWPAEKSPRRAGVSSFGIGGTNVHLLLEEAPPPVQMDPPRERQLLLLAAKDERGLLASAARLADHLENNPALALAEVAYTLHRGRAPLPQRLALAAGDAAEAIAALRDPFSRRRQLGRATPRQIYFLFPGQGSQHPGMAAEIYRSESLFRHELEACCAVLEPLLGLDLLPLLLATGDPDAAARLQSTELAQPALFAVEWSLATLWRSWGIEPAGLLGHSLGEITAAAVAGVFGRDEALTLVAERGRLVAALPAGAMLALTLSEAELVAQLPPGLALATVNGPRDLVVAGPIAEIEAFAASLSARGVTGRRLHTSHAFHSPMMDPVLPALERLVAGLGPEPPRIPYLSNQSGDWVTAAEATDPGTWARHLRHTVRFGAALEKLFAEENAVLLEVGPGRALTALARRHPQRPPEAEKVILPSLPHPRDSGGELDALLTTVGALFTLGAEPDEEAFFAGRKARRVVLPTYPFDRRRCFIDERSSARTHAAYPAPLREDTSVQEPQPTQPQPSQPQPAEARVADPDLEAVLAIWRELLGGEIEAKSNFFDLGGHSLLAIQLANRLRAFGLTLTVPDILAGDFASPEHQAEAIRQAKGARGDFDELLVWVQQHTEDGATAPGTR